MVFRVRTVKIERNIVTTARECDRQRIDPVICDDDRRRTNRAPQVKRPSIARRALFNFRASRRVAAPRVAYSFNFNNPFTKESKHVIDDFDSQSGELDR